MQLGRLSCGSFLWKTTGLASIGSACWSKILSAKVTLWFSNGKGKKAQGKRNATLWCKRLALKIIKDASRFRRSLVSEPRKAGQTAHKPLDIIKPILWVFELVPFPGKKGHDFLQILKGVHDSTDKCDFQCSRRHSKTH